MFKNFICVGLSLNLFISIPSLSCSDQIIEIKEEQSLPFDSEALKKIPQLYGKEFKYSRLFSFSNDNFLLENGNGKFVLRIPGKDTHNFIDRQAEYKNSLLTHEAGFNPLEILYFDPSDGLQITRYLKDGIFLPPQDFQKEENINKIVSVLKKLHESGIYFQNKFDPFYQFQKILSLIKAQRNSIPEHFIDAYQRINNLQNLIYLPCFEIKPCHNDPVVYNFVLIDNIFQLIDWEYSGNNDPAWDLAVFSTIICLSKDQEELLVNCYSKNNNKSDLIHAKITFFKSLIYLINSAWTDWQSSKPSTKFSYDQLKDLSLQNFEKYRNIFFSDEFVNSLKILKCYQNCIKSNEE